MTRIALSIAVLATFAACSTDEDPDGSAPKTSVATAAAGDLTVELLTDTRLETGKTPIYVKVTTGSGQVVTDAAVTFTPMMAMVGPPPMEHSAPVIGCAPMTLGSDGLYGCEVVFQMQTNAAGSWRAMVGVTRPGMAEPAVATFDPIVVADSNCAEMFSYPPSPTTEPQTRYIVSMDFLSAPRVGLNPVVLTIHTRQTMMSYPPVDDATLVLDPQMPSMGHGSPGSVNPTLVAPGVYEGQLSFSMTGEWETTVTVSRGGVTIGTPVFVTTF